MSNVKLSWTLTDSTRELAAKLAPRANQIVRATALNVSNAAKESMSEPKHGKMSWSVADRTVIAGHQASAPGEAPAIDTGFLVNSIRMEPGNQTTAYVNVGAEYGEYLEFGTVHMAARPFLYPAMAAEEPLFIRRLETLFGTG